MRKLGKFYEYIFENMWMMVVFLFQTNACEFDIDILFMTETSHEDFGNTVFPYCCCEGR